IRPKYECNYNLVCNCSSLGRIPAMLHIFRSFTGTIKKFCYIFAGAALCVLIGASVSPAAVLDFFGPPPEGDPSAFTGPFIGLNFARDLLATLPPAFEGSLLGSSHEALGANNVLAGQLTSANVPTNSKPSPLFGAKSFTQQMLLF